MTGHDIVGRGPGRRAEYAGQRTIEPGVTEAVDVTGRIDDPVTMGIGGGRQEDVLRGGVGVEDHRIRHAGGTWGDVDAGQRTIEPASPKVNTPPSVPTIQ